MQMTGYNKNGEYCLFYSYTEKSPTQEYPIPQVENTLHTVTHGSLAYIENDQLCEGYIRNGKWIITHRYEYSCKDARHILYADGRIVVIFDLHIAIFRNYKHIEYAIPNVQDVINICNFGFIYYIGNDRKFMFCKLEKIIRSVKLKTKHSIKHMWEYGGDLLYLSDDEEIYSWTINKCETGKFSINRVGEYIVISHICYSVIICPDGQLAIINNSIKSINHIEHNSVSMIILYEDGTKLLFGLTRDKRHGIPFDGNL